MGERRDAWSAMRGLIVVFIVSDHVDRQGRDAEFLVLLADDFHSLHRLGTAAMGELFCWLLLLIIRLGSSGCASRCGFL